MMEESLRKDGAENVPYHASLLSRIQKLEEYLKGFTDGGGNKDSIAEDLPFKADILHRIQKLEEKTESSKNGRSKEDKHFKSDILHRI